MDDYTPQGKGIILSTLLLPSIPILVGTMDMFAKVSFDVNSDSEEERSDFGVFFSMMSGENDSRLKWPFVFILSNQLENDNQDTAFTI